MRQVDIETRPGPKRFLRGRMRLRLKCQRSSRSFQKLIRIIFLLLLLFLLLLHLLLLLRVLIGVFRAFIRILLALVFISTGFSRAATIIQSLETEHVFALYSLFGGGGHGGASEGGLFGVGVLFGFFI